jgi:hypothetical protein
MKANRIMTLASFDDDGIVRTTNENINANATRYHLQQTCQLCLADERSEQVSRRSDVPLALGGEAGP